MFGSIYTWSLSNVRDKTLGFPFNQYFPFLFLSLMGFLSATSASFFPKPLDNKPEIMLNDNSNCTIEDNNADINL